MSEKNDPSAGHPPGNFGEAISWLNRAAFGEPLHQQSLCAAVTFVAREAERLRLALETANARIDLDNAVCLCGCPLSDHEDVGPEDGEQCEHEEHECLRVAPAVLEIVGRVRLALETATRERDEAREEIARHPRRCTADNKCEPCRSEERAWAETEKLEAERDALIIERDALLSRPAPPADAKPSLDALAREVHEWAERTFPGTNERSKSEHLRREAQELADAPTDPEEMADVFILLANLSGYVGVNLAEAVAAKHAKNKARKWGKPDAHGVIEHVRETPPADAATEALKEEIMWLQAVEDCGPLARLGRIQRLLSVLDAPAPAAKVDAATEAAVECTGVAASWCPVHGNCSCPQNEDGECLNRSSVNCPLHGPASNHGDAEVTAVMSAPDAATEAVREAKERLWDAIDRESLGGTYLAARGLRAALSTPAPAPSAKEER